ncbi:KR-domain-containing protein, partial [Periconia macrospinosa]
VEVLDYTLHDVSIKTALVIPDDNDGIETMFTLQPSVHSDAEGLTWWNFNVSSCSTDGNWNSHMTGTIGINAHSPRPAPKEIPAMTQRVTGTAWNQALKSVGFDYGPSFQDMEDVRSDGKRYIAASSSTLKQQCGMIEGESRYVIHPATMDSCLQLIIVSIYAGRMQDMTCGAVPIQVDEVTIWPPTQAQLQNPKANAYSWTDERGIRSFNSGTQLVGSDGNLLMSMERLHSVAYEAAVPQQRGNVIKEQPFTELAWNIDFDTLTSESPVAHLSVNDLVALVSFKYPGINVLEFGTTNMVSLLKTEDLIDYTAAAESQQQLEELEPKLSEFSQAKALLINTNEQLEAQGLQQGKYDVILPGTFSNAAQLQLLLASGGRTIAAQSICESLGEDFSVLKLQNGLAISTAKEESKAGEAAVKARSIAIVYRNQSAEICDRLLQAVARLGSPRLVHLSHADFSSSEHVIVACDIEGPLLLNLESGELSRLRNMVSNASSVLWLSAGALMKSINPEQAMASGLARSITSEMAAVDFTTLDFDLDSITVEFAVNEATTALERQINHNKAKESEYCVQDRLVHISRLVTNDTLNNLYGPQSSVPKAIPFNPSDKLVGLPKASKLVFDHDKRAEKTVGPSDVQVRVLLSGLNKEDVLVRTGADYPTTFSHEIYGVITQAGANVSNLEIGDHVFGFNCDRLATYQTVSAELVQKVESSDVPEELVTLPMAFATAHHGLNILARLQSEEIVLILHGTGESGAAAIALSKSAGAKTYVAVRDASEAARVAAAFDLPSENVIPHLDYNLMAKLKALTGGRPADVVFSSSYVSPTVAQGCWREIATFGRFIETGRKNVLKRGALHTVPTNRGACYMAFDTLDIYKQKPGLLSSYLKHITELYRAGNIAVTASIEKKNISEYDRAVASFSDNFTSPKTIIEYAESSATIEVLPRRAELDLHADATYFLVGCLGGLGRSLTSWMVSRGARRFAFMSRSGADKGDAADLVRGLESTGIACQIIKGDVASKEDVDAALASIPSENPVRGVVHAAMVLRDGLFHSMEYDNWKTSIAPKVLGALNLHQALGDTNLDFFVCTSSTSGIPGTPGQANYAAGNAFLDSLARHRVLNGKRASSLVLPVVQNVGVVAENPEIEAALRRKGIYGIDEAHLLESFEAAIMTQSTTTPADHIIVGMDPSKLKDSLSSSDVTDSFWTENTRFKVVMQTINSTESSDKGGAGVTILKAIHGAESVQVAITMVAEHFTTKLERLLILDPSIFDAETIPIVDYGLDSMIGAELRNWIFKEYALDLPFQQLLGPGLTIAKFAKVVCSNQGLE